MMKGRRGAFLVVVAVCLLTVAARPAGAALINASFETGTTAGWTLSIPSGGAASVVTGHTGYMGTAYSPTDANYMLRLKTDGSGSYTRAWQDVAMSAADVLSGWAAFDARDYLPFNDNAYVDVYNSGGVWQAQPWYDDIANLGDYGDGPWTYWSWTAPVADTYRLRYSIANSLDSALDSYALFDAAPIPEPMTAILLGSGLVALMVRRRRKRQ